jgi:hypothetical protein
VQAQAAPEKILDGEGEIGGPAHLGAGQGTWF